MDVTVLAAELTEKTLWYPTILGVLVVVAAVLLFCGSIYLLLGTNMGARLGFLVAFTCLMGFMVLLTSLWITTASPLNTLKGRIDPEVATVLAAAVERLSAAGARIDADARPAVTLEKAASRFFPLLQAALSGEYDRPTIERFAQAEGDGQVAVTKRQTAMRHRDWLSHNEGRLQLRRRFEEFFTETDVLLLPVMPCVALRHDHSEPKAGRLVETQLGERPYWEINTWMAPAGACFLPVTVVPVGLTEAGMPVGVQIVGQYLGDRTTLAFARAMTPVVGDCPAPPGI